LAWGDIALQGAPATVNSTVTGSAKNSAWWYIPIPLDSSTWIRLSLVGLRRRKRGRNMWLLPCRFRGGSHRDSRGIAKKVAAKKYSIPKSTLEF